MAQIKEKTKATKNKTVTKKKVIDIRSVAAGYGDGNVIEKIKFDVKAGETFGLMGLNGAGKTTLIKIILGLMEASEGKAKILGKETLCIESKKNIAYLPERFEPPSFLSGIEFIKFSMKLYGQAFDEEEILSGADRLALDREALYKRVNTYSKGMRQKIGILATLLTQCPLLILDEPMSGLDPKARALVKDEIKTYRKKGKTIFLSSHILADMDEVCNRVGVLHGGNLLFLGTPNALKKEAGQEYLERAFLTTIEQKKAV